MGRFQEPVGRPGCFRHRDVQRCTWAQLEWVPEWRASGFGARAHFRIVQSGDAAHRTMRAKPEAGRICMAGLGRMRDRTSGRICEHFTGLEYAYGKNSLRH
ncbi:hypothetical protein TNIN_336241 [Trichonephila inaurata madagascariensis]|uniref:Uncharacterized protein n=1 Tax=Trichonephila inaurata madagascariensis TaxID=2747483 RepID=A0A8X6X812_9ARAC|nr:hypothetical protein TNIN_336241 [Trichonephila inaurata madagascariensis]